jgi:hypothetical protein
VIHPTQEGALPEHVQGAEAIIRILSSVCQLAIVFQYYINNQQYQYQDRKQAI